MRIKILLMVTIAGVLALTLVACQPAAEPAEAPPSEEVVAPTEEVETTEGPTPTEEVVTPIEEVEATDSPLRRLGPDAGQGVCPRF